MHVCFFVFLCVCFVLYADHDKNKLDWSDNTYESVSGETASMSHIVNCSELKGFHVTYIM